MSKISTLSKKTTNKEVEIKTDPYEIVNEIVLLMELCNSPDTILNMHYVRGNLEKIRGLVELLPPREKPTVEAVVETCFATFCLGIYIDLFKTEGLCEMIDGVIHIKDKDQIQNTLIWLDEMCYQFEDTIDFMRDLADTIEFDYYLL